MPSRFLTLVLSFLTLAVLAGCGPSVIKSDVLRFHTLTGPAGEGRTFAILPDDNQRGSLEFRTYADMVARRMQAQGFRQIAEDAKPQLAVRIFYAVDDGRTEIWTTPIYSYNDYWRRYYGGAAAWPYPYFDTTGANTNSTTIYTHRLELKIMDGASLRGGKREDVFEGRAVAERETRELVATMPFLVEALFDNFPGQNGVPTVVRVPEARGNRR